MNKLVNFGYSQLKLISQDNVTSLFMAVREKDNTRVIIKKLNSDISSKTDINYLLHEYKVLSSLQQLDVVPKVIELINSGNLHAIVTEDSSYQSIQKILDANGKMNLTNFLAFAIPCVEALDKIHSYDIIHKNFNTLNILYDYDSHQVKITNFSLSVEIASQKTSKLNVNTLEGTLPYISPEQTARMNYNIDYRSDYYSLGVTFYQLLTGILPFQGNDANELIYAHIAKMPIPVHVVDPNIPRVVSDTVMKLLEKEPAKRYQSLYGLLYDLTKCSQKIKDGVVELFDIAEKDISKELKPSEKIYGRDKQIDILFLRYEEVAAGNSNVLFIQGASGFGKTMLVQKLNEKLLQHHGYLISGKYEYLKRSIPYYAIAQALDKLIKETLTKNTEQLDKIKQRTLKALGDNAGVIIDFIPTLSFLIGKVEASDTIDSNESTNRFNHGITQLLKSLINQSMPITLFLDDLQWSDIASFELLKLFILEKIPYLLIIGAYREAEVDNTHPLLSLMREIKQLNIGYDLITLEALTKIDVNQYLVDSLNKSTNEVSDLVEVMYEKTLGNPFFLQRLLITLHQQKIIYFDNELIQWQWDINQVKQQRFSDNVIELLIGNIEQLDQQSCNLLSAAACIGSEFNIKLLAKIFNMDLEKVLSNIKNLVKHGYILTQESRYYEAKIYQFTHDRIKQAAYELLDDKAIQQTSLIIARELLLDCLGDDIQSEALFNIVDHYNRAFNVKDGQIDDEEIKTITQLNRQAARYAKESAAFNAAFNYYQMSLKWIEHENWQKDYNYLCEINIGAMECAFYSNQFKEMEKYRKKLKHYVNDIQYESQIVNIYGYYLLGQERYHDVTCMILELYKKAGLSIAIKPNLIGLIYDILKSNKEMKKYTDEDIINLKETADENIRIIFTHLPNLAKGAYLDRNIPLLFKANIKTLRLVLKYGYYRNSTTSLAGCMFMVSLLGNILEALKWAKRVFILSDRINIKRDRVEHIFTTTFVVLHYQKPLQQIIKDLLRNYEQAVHYGVKNTAALSIWNHFFLQYFMGVGCNELINNINQYRKKLKIFEENTAVTGLNLIAQSAYNLRYHSDHQTSFSELAGDYFNEHKQNEEINHMIYARMLLIKLSIAFILDTQKISLNIVNRLKGKPSKSLIGSYNFNVFKFYQALTYIQSLSNASFFQRLKMKIIIKKVLKKFQKYAQYCPDNYLSKYLIIKAFWNQYTKDFSSAEKAFEQAIDAGKKYRLLLDEAIANEWLGRHYLELKRDTVARYYLQAAYQCYDSVQMFTKTKVLSKSFSNILSHPVADNMVEKNINLNTQTLKVSDVSLNINSIQKSVEVISSTMVIDELLTKLLNLLIENAGAQSGCVLLPKEGKFYIEAYMNSQGEMSSLLESMPVSSDLIAQSVLQYVINTAKSVVLDNASKNPDFYSDPYISDHQVKSIICLPLISQNKITAILYLENNMIPKTFTEDRCQQLKFLSGQIAISIENAKLYTRTTRLNKAYQRFVPKNFIKLLGKKSVTHIQLGDYVEADMSILFADIRRFTNMSEVMTPEETFAFINQFLANMEPIIHQHNGFIDKYIGDAIMALFPKSANDAFECGCQLLEVVQKYNYFRKKKALLEVEIGIGINTGKLVLGTVGTDKRMDGTVISDAVNVASRMEALNKVYKTNLLLSEHTYQQLNSKHKACLTEIGQVEIRGKKAKINIYSLK
ncbi:MAG: GAF domain-containing protein [Gammaproteobacteria bacterium]|nr:MAG: GAF domain-containing protein [Gammaproteobacteria bacterium]UTW42353.1 AAA family ATPase [bacterium SCSIO 12844]